MIKKSFKDLDKIFPTPAKVDKYGQMDPLSFYGNVIPISHKIRFKLGYFSTNAISLLASGFARFIYNNGQVDFMINQFVNSNDYHLLNRKGKLSEIEINLIQSNYLKDPKGLEKILRETKTHFFSCLRYLLESKRLNIVPVTCADGEMSHYKEAIFTDCNGDKIYINGSCNFTQAGIIDNGESFVIRRSWRNTDDKELIEFEEKNFNKIFNKEAVNEFIYLKPENLKKIIYKNGLDKNLKELLDDEHTLLKKIAKRKGLEKSLKKQEDDLIEELERIKMEPYFPYNEGPREYQEKAYQNWCANNFMGIFAMATGTGKTITSLNCVLQEYIKAGKYKVIIVVPTRILVNQWVHEAKKFNFQNIFSSLEPKWNKRLSDYFLFEKLGRNSNFIFVTTYATYNKPTFHNLLKGENSEAVILIADEVHNLGSRTSLENLLPNIQKRIGLSATPARKYDEEGSSELENYFNSSPPCYTYSYSMSKAIDDKFLCRYNYLPFFAHLTEPELKAYGELSAKLLKHYDFSKNAYRPSANMLLIERKRIIHQAENKKEVFRTILTQILTANRGKLTHALVYVPEGFETDYSINEEEKIAKDDKRIIDDYSRIINSLGLTTHQILSETVNRENVLNQFEKGIISVLTAMKTLDEGVDIPATRYAIFCSSTGNPRQYVQRRGRILRKFEGKDMAYVYDIIVEPDERTWEYLPPAKRDRIKNMEINIFKSEIYRVANFIYACDNLNDIFLMKNENMKKLMLLCEKYDVDLVSYISELIKVDKICLT